MKETIPAINLAKQTNEETITIDKVSRCPICKLGTAPKRLKTYFYWDNDESKSQKPHDALHILYHCEHCNELFIRRTQIYRNRNHLYEVPPAIYSPRKNTETSFSSVISSLSPQFVEIYHQAEAAEYAGYTDISGMGYRKALEFLVKDYRCMLKPDESDTIKTNPLSNAIDGITEERIKSLARSATWLGNDEAHYERRHKNKDVSDMKQFISALVYFIEYEFTVQAASAFLGNKSD